MTQRERRDRASIVVTADPEMVYGAFADPLSLMAWLPPGSMTGRALAYDFREGGRYRIELTYGESGTPGAGKTTGNTDISTGRFVALEPGARITQTVEFESGDPAFAGEMIMTWSFERVSGGTAVTITAENVPTGIAHAEHVAGLRESLENLARYLRDRG